jgi:hypothetical protein
MGLDTTHNCWHGGYSSFNAWRDYVARAADIPLWLMEGYSQAVDSAILQDVQGPYVHAFLKRVAPYLPLSWDMLKPDILHVLLTHSDCDGEIAAADCGPLADRLEMLAPDIEQLIVAGEGDLDWWRARTPQFIAGLRLAASHGEAVEFH